MNPRHWRAIAAFLAGCFTVLGMRQFWIGYPIMFSGEIAIGVVSMIIAAGLFQYAWRR